MRGASFLPSQPMYRQMQPYLRSSYKTPAHVTIANARLQHQKPTVLGRVHPPPRHVPAMFCMCSGLLGKPICQNRRIASAL